MVKLTVNVVSAAGETVCDCAPPSLHPENRYLVAVSPCGDATESVWDEDGVQLKEAEPVYVTPSTRNVLPGGLDRTVTVTGAGVKPAVSVTGPRMITPAGFAGPLYEPGPEPVQPVKEYPGAGVAVIATDEAVSYQEPGGDTVPPGPACIVRRNWERNAAVYVAGEVAVTLWLREPPSLQEIHRNLLSGDAPFCRLSEEMEWTEPSAQLNVRGAV